MTTNPAFTTKFRRSVAREVRTWQGPRMALPGDRSPRAGGVLLMLAIFAGAGIGLATGQSTLGLLGGVAVGGLFAVAIWLADRRRDRL